MPELPAHAAGPPAAQVADLRRCVRDLVALSTLPALWTHARPAEVAEGLGDALLAILGCDFIYIRLHGMPGAAALQDFACARGLRKEDALDALRPHIEPCLGDGMGTENASEVVLGERRMRVSIHWFGYGGLGGVAVAGSLTPDFPTELQRLALGVAVNQAATTLERYDAEQRRHETERRFQQFMQNVPGMAWIKDSAGRYVYANETSGNAFGKSPGELLDRTDAELFGPDIATTCMGSDREVVESRAPLQVQESLRLADGQVRNLLVTKFPIPTADPGTVLIGGIAIDATERIAAEEALRESDRRKDEFLAMLAHELRNPLAPIRNAAQILKHTASETPSISWAATMIERQTQHMTRLVDDLLDVSRITCGKIVLRKERVVLQDIVRGVVESARPLMDAARHSLEVALPATPIQLDGDSTRLAQVLSNLLNNAAKYTPPGGHVVVDASIQDRWAVVRVRDDGIGIPREMLSQVFELFVQVDSSVERTHGGLGIGLTMVRQLVELHGGTVKAESAGAGSGTTMSVRIPLAVAGLAAVPAPQQAGEAAGLQCRILVVDDNRDAASSLGALLELAGCEVRLAHDGLEAIGAFSLFHPDVVVLDIGLPGMSGYDVVRHLHSLPANPAPAFIALTGFGKEEDRALALAAGFDFHLTKPVAFEKLREVLAQLRWRRQEDWGIARLAD